ncbi:zinc finger A20 and AN1 domain-containing stress-associated protein 1-like [Tripterygium wilfordii]|uniref:zinc finger A20 and AN1 domain-containing stress-associated protein 1-like n=1 Tax=Tripterygium wilfordii TaxID=458696 RepID=UPI0018F80C25|nr:zinc finger A20 and AN1 domain-containing stress-associated protein 1-like [Tripterygium wilfordii]
MDSQSPPLCVEGCGFYASLENNNMCSKCYTDSLKQCLTKSLHSLSPTIPTSSTVFPNPSSSSSSSPLLESGAVTEAADGAKKQRCKKCNKKVGLLGFQCRCKDVFCGSHRYPEEHCCTVDWMTPARKVLVSQNPVVKADKLEGRV